MTKLEQAKNRLEETGASLVVIKDEKITEYYQNGIHDLIDILKKNEEALKGAIVADKIIGKVAAGIMIEAGVLELYTFKLSKLAIPILEKSQMKWEAQEVIPHIIRRDKTGMCPMENQFKEETSTKKIYEALILS